jgi:hypothetical protein
MGMRLGAGLGMRLGQAWERDWGILTVIEGLPECSVIHEISKEEK